MDYLKGQGNFVDGDFIGGGSETITSHNPSENFKPVFSVNTDIAHVDLAVLSARRAHKSWRKTSFSERKELMLALKAAFVKHESQFQEAISSEMGKIASEALVEAKGLSARIDLILNHGLKRVDSEPLYDLRAETRHHSQGVLAVIGPFNFPAHLVNGHVIPAILTGNCVVVKPSEVCPKVAEIYASCFKDAGFPKGRLQYGSWRWPNCYCTLRPQRRRWRFVYRQLSNGASH